MYDRTDRRCGAFMQADVSQIRTFVQEGCQLDLVLLSRSRQENWEKDDRSRGGLITPPGGDVEPYYEDIFHPRYYQHKPEWALNVMLVKWKGNSAERVAIGQIHVDAWNEAPTVLKAIVLI